MDEELDDLNSDLNDQTPTIEQEPIFPRSTPTSRQPSRRMDRIASSSTAFSEEPAEGMDLAAELGRAGISDESKPDAVEEENKKLREEVKALQLYCSKVGPSLDNSIKLIADHRPDYRSGWIRTYPQCRLQDQASRSRRAGRKR